MTTADRHRDPALEDILVAQGIATEPAPTEVHLDTIDQAASEAAQTRDVALDPDTVERYADDLADGADFPAVLARDVGDGRLVVIGGLHRLAAHRTAGQSTIWAYTIRTTDEIAYQLSLESNARHGRALTTDEQFRHAQHLIDNGDSVRTAARRVGLTQSKLATRIAAVEGTRRANRLQCAAPWERITSETSRQRLHSIVNDAVFTCAVEEFASAGVKGQHLNDAVARINKAPTIQDQMAILDDIADEHDARKNRSKSPGGGRPNHTGAARGAAFEILDLADHVDAVIAGCPNSDRARLANHTRRAGRILLQIAESLED